jgi:hypothetical protein
MEDQANAKNKDMATAKDAKNKGVGGFPNRSIVSGVKPKEETKDEEKAAE